MRFETEEGEEGDRQVLSKDSILQTINDKIYGQKKIKKKKKKKKKKKTKTKNKKKWARSKNFDICFCISLDHQAFILGQQTVNFTRASSLTEEIFA